MGGEGGEGGVKKGVKKALTWITDIFLNCLS